MWKRKELNKEYSMLSNSIEKIKLNYRILLITDQYMVWWKK